MDVRDTGLTKEDFKLIEDSLDLRASLTTALPGVIKGVVKEMEFIEPDKKEVINRKLESIIVDGEMNRDNIRLLQAKLIKLRKHLLSTGDL